MTYAQPDPPDDDAERLALVLAPRMRECIRALLNVTMVPNDQALVQGLARRDPATLTAQQRHWIAQLLWRYRRNVPSELRPKLNPDDPIVREMEMAGV
jgi:hypothetical protein